MDFLKSQELKYRTVVRQGKKICDITYRNFKPSCNIKRIGKKHYIKIRRYTVEVKDYTPTWEEFVAGKRAKWHTEERIYTDGEVFEMREKQPDENGGMRNKRSLRHIFQELRYLINSNFDEDEADKQLFVTLTYRENMQDDKRLHDDFRKFIMRLKHNYKQHELAYISIVEPQGRGAWHVHMLLKTLNQPTLFIPHEDIEKLWGHGMTRTERLQSDNVGSYFIAYLSNAELSDEKIKDLDVKPDDIREKDGKKYIKGSRMAFYPEYMQIYRHSRNVNKPDRSYLQPGIIREKYPQITYQGYKEISNGREEDAKVLKVAHEQRRTLK